MMKKFSLCCASKVIKVRRRGEEKAICNACKKEVVLQQSVIKGVWKDVHGGLA